jgi:hypothetical protein
MISTDHFSSYLRFYILSLKRYYESTLPKYARRKFDSFVEDNFMEERMLLPKHDYSPTKAESVFRLLHND